MSPTGILKITRSLGPCGGWEYQRLSEVSLAAEPVPVWPHLILSPLLLPYAQVEQLEVFQREQTKQVMPGVLAKCWLLKR